MDLVFEVIFNYPTAVDFATIMNFNWATGFIYCFTTMAAFVGVAIIAMQRPSGGMVRKNSRDQVDGRMGRGDILVETL
jgi:hypothetical protein